VSNPLYISIFSLGSRCTPADTDTEQQQQEEKEVGRFQMSFTAYKPHIQKYPQLEACRISPYKEYAQMFFLSVAVAESDNVVRGSTYSRTDHEND
jgi:hypothetical protein